MRLCVPFLDFHINKELLLWFRYKVFRNIWFNTLTSGSSRGFGSRRPLSCHPLHLPKSPLSIVKCKVNVSDKKVILPWLFHPWVRSSGLKLSRQHNLNGTTIQESHEIVYICIMQIFFFLAWLLLTKKSRADVCLRAHVDDKDPLTGVGLGIVGREVVREGCLPNSSLSL